MLAPGCGRSARPKCAPERGTLAGQGANDADQVAFRVLEPRPLASIRRASNAFLCPTSPGCRTPRTRRRDASFHRRQAHFGDLNDGLRELARRPRSGGIDEELVDAISNH